MTIVRMQAGAKGRSSWGTPRPLFERYHRRYNFTIDLAADAQNAKLPVFYSRTENALRQVWRGRGWLNPPYDDLWPWLEKSYHAVLGRDRTMELVVLLLPVRTDCDWFHEIVKPYASAIEFLRGRVHMIPPPGWTGRRDQPAEASMIVTFERRLHARIWREQ